MLLDAASDPAASSTELILQTVVGILSVPAIAAGLAALARLLLPTTRLSSRLRRDLAIFKDLPPSAARDEFENYINSTLALLNKRYQLGALQPEPPKPRAHDRATHAGGTFRLAEHYVRQRRLAQTLSLVAGLALLLLSVAVLIAVLYETTPRSGQSQPITGSLLLPIAFGAATTAIILPLGLWLGNRATRIRIGRAEVSFSSEPKNRPLE